jgi:hypothetical protein
MRKMAWLQYGGRKRKGEIEKKKRIKKKIKRRH